MAQNEERGKSDEQRADPVGDVLLLVCLECGREYEFEGAEEPPEDLKCEKCGNTVFRRFDDTAKPSEALEDFRESTDRDMATDDAEGDTVAGDLYDLNNP